MFQKQRKSRRLSIQSLENRQMMAGDVDVSLDGGVLELEGDWRGNGVMIEQLDANSYRVKGFTHDGNATTVNNSTAPQTYHGVNQIEADFNSGNDRMLFWGNYASELRYDLRVETDSGDDLVQVYGLHIGDDLDIDTGSGDDKAYLQALRVDDHTDIEMGTGSDFLQLYASDLYDDTNIRTHGSNWGDGRDEVYLTLINARDRLDVETGDGNDYVSIQAVNVDSYMRGTQGELEVDLGDDKDILYMRQVSADVADLDGDDGYDRLVIGNDVFFSQWDVDDFESFS